jgi:hypothetical protein
MFLQGRLIERRCIAHLTPDASYAIDKGTDFTDIVGGWRSLKRCIAHLTPDASYVIDKGTDFTGIVGGWRRLSLAFFTRHYRRIM